MIGRKLGNRYEILDQIGGGGMAVVYRALDTLLNRYVSIKVLRSQFVTDEDFVRRFRREAQSAASLSHPNVVNIYDVGVENDTYYIVMEYINGKTLNEIIQERAPLPIPEAIEVTKQICSALQHAHENNIVHRDIKPHNILISREGRVKVTDFGIARAISSNTLTHSGSVLGSVHYFSPEQARGGITDVKSDIYSLGVVLYEMLTGELPFTGETPISVALKHLQDDFIDPRQINPKIPQSLENIILQSLAKDPTVRYHSTREMYRDLEKSLQNPHVPKFIVPVRSQDTMPTIQMPALNGIGQSKADGTSGANGQKPVKPNKKRKPLRVLLWTFGILVLALAAVIGGYWLTVNTLKVPDVVTPNVQGMKYSEAVDELKKAGFTESNIQRADDSEVPEPGKPPVGSGKVFKQSPEPEQRVKANRTVTLTVSNGTKAVGMPSLIGSTEEQARDQLRSMGIQDSQVTVTADWSTDQDKGKVFKTNPAPQVPITSGDTAITLYVSKGIETVKMPDLTNKPVSEALKILQDAKLTVGNYIDKPSLTVAQGIVMSQAPYQPNQDAPKGSLIDLIVSSGPPSDAKQRSFRISVSGPINKQQPVQVTIKVTDARGTQTAVNNDPIKDDKVYQVDVVLTPNSKGIIEVYQNGKLTDRKEVPYE